MNFSSSSQIIVIRFKEFFFSFELCTGYSVSIKVLWMLLNFTDWETSFLVLLCQRNSRWISLLPWARFPASKPSDMRIVLFSCIGTRISFIFLLLLFLLLLLTISFPFAIAFIFFLLFLFIILNLDFFFRFLLCFLKLV